VTQLYWANPTGGPRAHPERHDLAELDAVGEIMRTAYEAHAEDDDFVPLWGRLSSGPCVSLCVCRVHVGCARP
jgi:hypothetical protein